MTAYWWTGNTSGVWELATNWSSTPSGSVVAADYPGNGTTTDIVIFDTNNVTNCIATMNAHHTINALISDSGCTDIIGGAFVLTINGGAVFISDGINAFSNLNGSAIFGGALSQNYLGSGITGSAIFSGSDTSNSGNITGDAIFSGNDSYNSVDGIVGRNAIFSGTSSNNNFEINGSAIFSGTNSINYNYVYSSAIFSGSNSRNNEVVAGSAVFYGIYSYNNYDASVNSGAIFYGDVSYNVGNCYGVAVFHGSDSYNDSNIIGSAIFKGAYSQNYTTGGISQHALMLAAGTSNLGTVSGAFLPMVPLTGTVSTGTAVKYPLDILAAGI